MTRRLLLTLARICITIALGGCAALVVILSADFKLCEVGWSLYMRWSRLLEDKREPEARVVMREYYAHRAVCPECTKPMGVSSENN